MYGKISPRSGANVRNREIKMDQELNRTAERELGARVIDFKCFKQQVLSTGTDTNKCSRIKMFTFITIPMADKHSV